MLTVFLDMKGLMIIDNLEKGANVNSVSYCQFLRQISPFLLNDPDIKKTNKQNMIICIAIVFYNALS